MKFTVNVTVPSATGAAYENVPLGLRAAVVSAAEGDETVPTDSLTPVIVTLSVPLLEAFEATLNATSARVAPATNAVFEGSASVMFDATGTT